MIEAIVVVILGIFAGAAITTIMPFYLKLKAIQEKADEQGVEPVLPKFGAFYIVSAGISIVIAGVMNLGLAQELAESNPTANFTQLFITSLLASAGSNAILNLIPKTGHSDATIKKETTKSGKKTVTSDDEPPLLGGSGGPSSIDVNKK
jgi:uncharacterized membrane protein YiaA